MNEEIKGLKKQVENNRVDNLKLNQHQWVNNVDIYLNQAIRDVENGLISSRAPNTVTGLNYNNDYLFKFSDLPANSEVTKFLANQNVKAFIKLISSEQYKSNLSNRNTASHPQTRT